MSILVTGATGYIGSHVCKILHDKGIKFDALDIDPDKNDIHPYTDTFYMHDVRQAQCYIQVRTQEVINIQVKRKFTYF